MTRLITLFNKKDFCKTHFYIGIAFLICFLFICLIKIVSYFLMMPVYTLFDVSDWLINYEGGFVRRGLVGELLYFLYSWTSCPIKRAILWINSISFLACFLLIIKSCRVVKYSTIPFLVIYCGVISQLGFYRRDFLVLIIVYGIISSFFCYLREKKRSAFLITQILTVSVILIHEATFFFIVPIMFFINWFASDKRWISREKAISAIKCFTLPVIAMAMVSVYKGNWNVATSIWQSWMPMFLEYPDSTTPLMGLGVEWLYSRSVIEASKFHLDWNFMTHQGTLVDVIRCMLTLCLTFACTYFVVLRSHFFNFRKKCLENHHHGITVGNILLLQFVFMIPMFTILSTDYGRTILYCVVSSIFIAAQLRLKGIALHIPLLNISERIDRFVSHNKILSSYWTFYLVIMLFPIRTWHYITLPNDMFLYKYITLAVKIVLA